MKLNGCQRMILVDGTYLNRMTVKMNNFACWNDNGGKTRH